jgi:hypothetical protein
MRKITILIAVLVIGILYADTVIFSEEPDASADNIQGRVWIWNNNAQQYEYSGAGEIIYVYLYYDEDHGGGLFDSGYDITDSNSWYSYNFQNSGSNSNFCDLVKVCYNGQWYQSVYDGIVRIDIYYHPDEHAE